MARALLIEIGCEEIPARMIARAAVDLGQAVEQILSRAGLDHGKSLVWGGSRRLMVRIEAVDAAQPQRTAEVLGPPESAAFDAEGRPTRAAEGFARKQGVEPQELEIFESERGRYVGVRREVGGRTLGQILADELPAAVAGMRFPKTMRWSDGVHRWVRPVHWLVALHGEHELELSLFGVGSSKRSEGHRFLADSAVEIGSADRYAEDLAVGFVVADPAERRRRIADALQAAAAEVGGEPVEDAGLLEEVADLVEWPGVHLGGFDEDFLDLPREILVTTLRHHQKCFSVEREGRLAAHFLAVANTDRDPGGHVRRGNEWVVSGRLEDARFFWKGDRERTLESRLPELGGIVFHKAVGSYLDLVEGTAGVARTLAETVGLSSAQASASAAAARLSKADLVTGLVGEFPELQGNVGGLLLEREGADAEIHRAVYEHYRPAGAGDSIPSTPVGRVVAAADKLHTVARMVEAGERPTGSKDPFALRRALNGVYRIAAEADWPVGLTGLANAADSGEALIDFLSERLPHFLRERGYTANEIQAVLRPRIDEAGSRERPVTELVARLEALTRVRGREDFDKLVDLVKRVDNILAQREEGSSTETAGFEETETAALDVARRIEASEPRIAEQAAAGRYHEVVDEIAGFIDPVEGFFDEVLVLDPERPAATEHRCALLARLRGLLTSEFDIRELAGQAERRS